MRYTESENALRLSGYLDSLGAEPSTPRNREYVWALVCLTLAVAWLDAGNLGTQIALESYPASVVKNCERNTRVAVAALNGWTIQTDEVKVACKRVKS